ncbi:MAG: hypothetical protein R2911_21755 [Caldilineaceae bacterium]
MFSQSAQTVGNHSPADNAAAMATASEAPLVVVGLDPIHFETALRNGNRSSRTQNFVNNLFIDAQWYIYSDNTFELNYGVHGEPGTVSGEYFYNEETQTLHMEAPFFEATLSHTDNQTYFTIEFLFEASSGDTYKAKFFQLAQIVGDDEAPAPVTLQVINRSRSTICYLYISETSAENWGEDWLGSEEMVKPNYKREFTLQPGTYDLLVEDCDGNEIVRLDDVQIEEDSTWTVQE